MVDITVGIGIPTVIPTVFAVGVFLVFCSVGRRSVVVDGPQTISPLHRLTSLVLKNVYFDTLFLAHLSSKFPSVKDLTLHINGGREEILISSPTLERLDFNLYSWDVHVVKLDVPSIRKFTFASSDIPDGLYVTSNSRGWESCVSLSYCTCLSTSWFNRLSIFMEKLRFSRILSLSLHVKSQTTFDYEVGDVQEFWPIPEIENLNIYHVHLPSISCYALFDGDLSIHEYCKPVWCTRPPKSNIIRFLVKIFLEARGEKVPTPKYQFMYGLNDLNAQVFDEDVSTWRDVTLESLLDEDSTFVENNSVSRFQLNWKH